MSRRTTIAIGVVCVVALATTAWNLNGAWDARRSAVTARDATRTTLDTTRADLASARRRVDQDLLDGRRARAERDAATLSANLRKIQLAATKADRDRATQLRDTKTAEVAVVRQCITGANVALDALQRHDDPATLFALRAVDGACRAAQAAQSGVAPGYGFDFPDPFVLTVGATEYAFGTNATAGNIQVLFHQADGGWATVGDALAQLPTWATRGRTWAPSVLARPGGYVLYYAVNETATGHQCISRAVATQPKGPYVDTSAGPLTCGDREAIDPDPVIASDGNPFLLFKREHPATIVSQALTADGLALVGPERELLHADRSWESGVVEAPSMLVTANGAWLFFAGNDWNGRHYATGVVHCTGPIGPCGPSPAGPVLASHDAIAGPGGASVFQEAPGRWRVAYHAYLAPNVGYPASRLLFVGTLDLSSGIPVIVN
ncbi:MAG: glycoside hydrolase family 43 protein [Acidimicrobiia bacterium]